MKKVVALLVLALAAFALVACGGDDDDSTTPGAETTTESTTEAGGEAAGGEAAGGEAAAGGSTVAISAVPDSGLEYEQSEVTAKTGNLTIDFDNPQTITHDVAVEDSGGKEIGKTELIADDSTSAAIGDLKPGEYTFFCTVPGHREGGMEGTLTVE